MPIFNLPGLSSAFIPSFFLPWSHSGFGWRLRSHLEPPPPGRSHSPILSPKIRVWSNEEQRSTFFFSSATCKRFRRSPLALQEMINFSWGKPFCKHLSCDTGTLWECLLTRCLALQSLFKAAHTAKALSQCMSLEQSKWKRLGNELTKQLSPGLGSFASIAGLLCATCSSSLEKGAEMMIISARNSNLSGAQGLRCFLFLVAFLMLACVCVCFLQ